MDILLLHNDHADLIDDAVKLQVSENNLPIESNNQIEYFETRLDNRKILQLMFPTMTTLIVD